MGAVAYYLTLPFLYLISLLPFWLLHRLSDLIFVLLYYVVRYRRKVVLTNLQNSFPGKSDREIGAISWKFYRFFCDLLLETAKALTISERSLRKHVQFPNPEVLQHYLKQEQSVIIVMGHWGNWELAGLRFGLAPVHQLYVLYHPLKNKYFDRLISHMRTRTGNRLYSMQGALRGMIRDRSEVTATCFIADQTPSSTNAHWMTFLNQDTPVFAGTEKLAAKFKYPVIYIGVRRLRRGYYSIDAELLVAKPGSTAPGEISEIHTRRLEQDIRELPQAWLWTHRRWKRKRAVAEQASPSV